LQDNDKLRTQQQQQTTIGKGLLVPI